MKRTLNDIEKQQYKYLIKILSSAVNSTPAPIPYEGISWLNLMEYARRCSLNSIFSNTVLSLPKKCLPPKKICDKLKQNSAKELLIDGNLSYEVELLLKNFDKFKIKNIPLKGYFMKQEYSRPDFRSVSDIDILFDISQLDTVKQAFDELGYDFVHYDDNQFHFQKRPVMYVEMHSTLVHFDEYYFPYLKNQLDNSSRRSGYEYSYNMSIEDYYIYMLVHNSNHFRIAGMGVRMMLDTYLFYKNHQNEFDYDYLNERLRLFRLDKFENKVRQIAFNWFSKSEPVITYDDIETFILLSGTLGRVEVGVMIDSQKEIKKAESAGKKKSKFAYFISSVFPPFSTMVIDNRYLEKAPFLLPYSWIERWFVRFFIKKNVHIKKGIKNRMSYTNEDIACYQNMLDELGFQNFGIRNNN